MALRGRRSQPKKSRPLCEHYKKTGHSKDTCWFIHGKPGDNKFPRSKEACRNAASSSMLETPTDSAATEVRAFNKEQMEVLQKLFQQALKTDGTVTSIATIAQKGNILNVLSICKGRGTTWIIDSGASIHMTGYLTTFNKYLPCRDRSIVRIADGSLSEVIGKGLVVILKDIIIKDVLYVPKPNCNLLSISKLMKDLKCVTKFHSFLCEFQALDLGKRIGNAEECACLYRLRVDDSNRRLERFACVVASSKEASIMLGHYCLGHPNFMYLRRMFPSLFNKNLNFFHCEVCELSKHIRNTYPAQPYKPSKPFTLIHSDV